ncbi:NAD(P)/FAD-dependent oxidoreductase [Ktedonosporobacter rubrisoli]|uniref:NAD(P)/FAD-dependent oxidoreductase n=1 Tax=Ktedonosporobacter rubrisoli TaxID=2509675 RepID=A0A4P6K1H0_KTERU|nr:NAD(P)/FAD-dependent oxidoreductase [Ktedonosporobacter rubrisoli]QBD81919.1 NAD(P)/FAD-dependent oxidoreductase [Ktedonosporobacter rubrisoli]
MPKRDSYDTVIVGAGPNGLAAAIALAQEGRGVLLVEANATIGGGARSKELTLPGFVHDVCSAIHPLGLGSPFFQTLPLEQYGLRWLHAPIPLAHPLGDGSVALLDRSLEATAATLGQDAQAYMRLIAPLVDSWDKIVQAFLGPLRLQPLLSHPLALTRFALSALRSPHGLVDSHFKGEQARALMAGLCAHSMLPLDQVPGAAIGLMLALAGHTLGWPMPEGGSQKIVDALAAYLRALGGEIVTGVEVKSLWDLPRARAIIFDLTPRQLVRIVGTRLPTFYRESLQRYRYGPGAFKVDYALDGPVPWKDDVCLRAGTVHLGGSFAEIAAAEKQVALGVPPERPYVLLAQQSLFDPTRAPAGKQTLWAYCHVPNGSMLDMTERIEAQIERFAPGFRERVLARHVMSPLDFAQYNANYVGGDINGGIQDLWQLFTRPALRLVPYTTPLKNIYICSSSTPPGGGVHGMCGYFAAQALLRADARHSAKG